MARSRRRTFTPTEKLDLLAGYEEAIAEQKVAPTYAKMASTLLRHRVAQATPTPGVLEGKTGGDRIGKLSVEQAEIARLRRQLEVSEEAEEN